MKTGLFLQTRNNLVKLQQNLHNAVFACIRHFEQISRHSYSGKFNRVADFFLPERTSNNRFTCACSDHRLIWNIPVYFPFTYVPSQKLHDPLSPKILQLVWMETAPVIVSDKTSAILRIPQKQLLNLWPWSTIRLLLQIKINQAPYDPDPYRSPLTCACHCPILDGGSFERNSYRQIKRQQLT